MKAAGSVFELKFCETRSLSTGSACHLWKYAIAIVLCLWVSGALAGERGLTSVYQPLTTADTDQELAILVTKVPVIAEGVSESLLELIAKPNRLLQSKAAQIPDSNLLSRLGASLNVTLSDKPARYLVILDLTPVKLPADFGISLDEVIRATLECVRRTIEETRLYHPADRPVEWQFQLKGLDPVPEGLRQMEKIYTVPARN